MNNEKTPEFQNIEAVLIQSVRAERAKARQKGYEEGYHAGMELGRTLNPKIKQGMWLPAYGDLYCSQCREVLRDYRTKHLNFCNCCGAAMKREGEDD